MSEEAVTEAFRAVWARLFGQNKHGRLVHEESFNRELKLLLQDARAGS